LEKEFTMKHWTRLSVEHLESRWCPSLTAALRGTTLTISGTADNGSISVVQDTTTAGTIRVLDGTTAVSGSPFTGVTNIRLNLTDADDRVKIDLGGQTLSGNVVANLGDGANDLTVVHGGVGGRLIVGAGEGDDAVTLGDGTADLSVRDAFVNLDGGIDTLTVKSGVDVSRSLSSAFVNEWALDDGATAGNVYVRGGSGGNTVTVAGDVTGNLVVDAFFRSGSSAGTTVNVTGEVDGSVVFLGSDMDDTFTVSGDVGRSVAAATLGGADAVTVGGAVTGRLALDTGAGDDTIIVASAVGGRTAIAAGAGDDELTLAAAAKLTGAAAVSMGAGADTVTVDDAATIATLFINGGTGTDTFVGTRTRTGLTLVSFS
jgi:hypothetical protein